tara:strand:- start:770 stop:1108 length:339 start_codon:yes stop_codon:yes gene_type:complete
MNLTLVILFTAISFIVYGYSSFVSRRMKSEYARWGYNNQRKIVGFLQLLGGLGLVIGIKIDILLILTSFCFIMMMIMAIFIRIKIKDNVVDILPAITYLFLNILIFYNSITS